MAKMKDTILVIDVEATCWEERDFRNISEIIEIGITKVHRTGDLWTPRLQIEDTTSFVVSPQFSKVSAFCTQLTGWTQASLDTMGKPYPEVLHAIKKNYPCQDSIIACWGKYDDKMFQSMSQLYKLRYPFSNDYLNVKALFGTIFGQTTSVPDAAERLGLGFEGTPHRGSDDSRNIARILKELIDRE